MNIDAISVNEDIPGVLPARQARSRRIRDAYIEAGIKLLNSMRFNDLKVSDLAQDCGQSVGSFYTRFEDKEAYFRALRAAAINLCNLEIHARIGGDKLYEMEPEEALDELVDLMADLFTGPVRGVLRESLLRILEPDDPWAPMRDSAREIMRNYRRACGTQFPAFDQAETQTRLSFCFQLVVGALQNDLVNDYHVFSTKDQSLRSGLKEVVRSYMHVGQS
ncbi:TetR/AcrR family transcriptional regulator [Ruegeria sp. WL0004]|uniref:TetR/AcrR family transcriptional regulator n=1 Tax=Ruegeria marisflavi TaxID=2984152 RepID=A0ABT2WWS2_9RHOB|nr:TetR/AcrR family transcriptional regulator [Ruegeria sp. WL0004]MCU9840344.1 TetR/AcrR family transcriptional regulator [Ruegeria sp. WL0004]